MTLRENIKEFWFDMTLVQRAAVAAAVLSVVLLLGGSMFTAVSSWVQLSRLEREANAAKRDAEAALASALKIAQEKKVLELKIESVEAQRNEKQTKVDEAKRNSDAAIAEYERVIRQPRTDNPSTEQLCAELAELGYPCR